MFTLKEKSWNKRYNDTKALYEEFCENRVDLVTQLYSNCAKKKRKASMEEDLEHTALKFKAKDDQIELLEETNERLNSLVETLRNSLKVLNEPNYLCYKSNCSYLLMSVILIHRSVKMGRLNFKEK